MNDRLLAIIVLTFLSMFVLNLVAGMNRWNGWEVSEPVNVICSTIVGGAVAQYMRHMYRDDGDRK